MSCDCMTCRIAREAFGENLGDVSSARATEGVQSLVEVLAVGLSFAEDSALDTVASELRRMRDRARINVSMASHHEAGNA